MKLKSNQKEWSGGDKGKDDRESINATAPTNLPTSSLATNPPDMHNTLTNK